MDGPIPDLDVQLVRVIERPTGSDESYFGSIVDMDVDMEGQLYVLDQVWHAAFRLTELPGSTVTFGSPGTGPGEFPQGGGLRAVLLDGMEAVYLADMSGQRLARFSPAGEFITDVSFEHIDGQMMGWDGGGDRILAEVLPSREMQPGGRNARVIRKLMPRQGTSDAVVDLEPEKFSRAGYTYFLGGVPAWTVARDGRLAVGFTRRRSVQVYDDQASVVRIEISREATRVTREEREAVYRENERMFERAGLPPDQIAALQEGLRVEDSYPFFTDLTFGPYGTLWLEVPATVSEVLERGGALNLEDGRGPGSNEWDVFDREGRRIARAAIPGFRPHAYRGDLLYGVEERPTGEQLVAVYRVTGIEELVR